MEFLKLFDAPSVIECYERTTSIAPQQALALANSDLTIRQSRNAARNLGKQEPGTFVELAFAAVLARAPTAGSTRTSSVMASRLSRIFGRVIRFMCGYRLHGRTISRSGNSA